MCSSMAGLVSPKPISYLQQTNSHYSNYARTHQNFSDTPPLSNIPHPIPQSQFTPGPGPTTSVQEDGKIYGLVIDLLDPNLRESALVELSKKREQYDDLALVLWHSFGMSQPSGLSHPLRADRYTRHNARPPPGNRFCVSSTIPSEPHCPRLEPCL